MYHIDTCMTDKADNNVVKFERPIHWDKILRTDEAERTIKKIAEVDDNIIISKHTYDRRDERSALTDIDTYRIIKEGHVFGVPEKNEEGYWEVIVTMRIQGNRDCGAVTIIFHDTERLFVKTVEWIDL